MHIPEQQHIKKVKEEFYLPLFQLNEFFIEINTLINHFKHKEAKLLLQLAATKIKNTGKDAGNDEINAEEMLEDINYAIENIDFEIDFYNLPNIDFNNDIEHEEMFQFRFFKVKDYINPWLVNQFYSIENRLIREGYYNYDGAWIRNERALVYIINMLWTAGFFQSRKKTGKWFTTRDYVNFFERRYYINLEQFVDFNELTIIEDNATLPWLTDYLKV